MTDKKIHSISRCFVADQLIRFQNPKKCVELEVGLMFQELLAADSDLLANNDIFGERRMFQITLKSIPFTEEEEE